MGVGYLRFRALPGGRRAIVAVFCWLAVFGIAVAVRLAVSGNLVSGTGLFLLFWFLVILWNGYMFLAKICTELRFDGEVLVAMTVVSERRIPIGDFQAVRPYKFGPAFVVFELSDGSTVMAMVGNGFGTFVEAISKRLPDLPVRLGPPFRLVGSHKGLKQIDEPLLD